MIVVLDNQDSFVFNLARYFVLLGSEVKVLSSHETSLEDIESTKPKALVISPGPCTPKKAGVSIACVRKFRGRVPLLGVCLGHQVIVEALGGVIRMSNEPRHGRMSRIYHERTDLFSGISNPMSACRYHSLVVEEQSLPRDLRVTARTQDGVIMAVENEQDHVYGVQFHPESILTQGGFRLLANFLSAAGLPVENELVDQHDRSICHQAGCAELPVDNPTATRVVTF